MQPILTLAELRTLAMIAYQQPVMQSSVAKVRGQQSYNHIKNLIRNGFVKAARVKQTLELYTDTEITTRKLLSVIKKLLIYGTGI